MKKIIVYTFILLFLLVSVVRAKEYKRIVSLAPSVTKSLYELGTEEFIVGITVYCPKGITKKEIIGTLLEPNIEKIAFLNPDLIVLTKEGNAKATAEKLKRLGFEIYIMETAKDFNEICVNYYNLAEKLGKTKEGKQIVSTAKYLLERIHNKLRGFNELRVFWEINANPLYTAGERSFISNYGCCTKSVNIYKDFNIRYFTVDIESVIERNPDIILIVNMGDIDSKEIVKWNKYNMVKAVKNNKVFIIDVDSNIFSPTPLTFAKSAIMIAKIIHGDIFSTE